MRLFMPMVSLLTAGTFVLAVATVWLGYAFHQFEELEDAGELDCQPVHGITGAYDMAAVPGTEAAFISVYDERGDVERGEIIRFDFANPLDSSSWRDRTGGTPYVLKPGGIDLYEERLPSGVLRQRLFVVNEIGPEVLLFDVDKEGGLTLAERFSHPQLTSPNDVAATGWKSFYVTNDTAAGRNTVRGRFDFLAGLPTGTILHFDGRGWAIAAERLRYPNGIALGADGASLHLAEMRAEAVRVYKRDTATNALEEERRVAIGSFPSNLSVDGEGGVLVGAVPQPFAYMAFVRSLRDSAPSQVLRLGKEGADTIFQDTGAQLSAATSASLVGERVVIGTAADEKFLMCTAP